MALYDVALTQYVNDSHLLSLPHGVADRPERSVSEKATAKV